MNIINKNEPVDKNATVTILIEREYKEKLKHSERNATLALRRYISSPNDPNKTFTDKVLQTETLKKRDSVRKLFSPKI